MPHDLVTDIGTSVALAAGMALLSRLLRQPLILGYVACGIILGPGIGFGLIESEENIRQIGEIGLVLLLFMIGLEIDLSRLMRLGRPVVFTGAGQVFFSVLLGLGFFPLMGFAATEGRLDALYLAAAASLSSTMIVVKLLYDKMELDTLAGRITVGVLVIQDLWAILFIALQPDLQDPKLLSIGLSVLQGAGLVVASLLISRYVLAWIFHRVARQPELVMLLAVGWCFAVAGLAGEAGLSREMGALIAGISISAFPYNHDILNRVLTLRDFFVTLFFVSLGLQVPRPTGELVGYTLAVAGFVLASRLLTVFPALYAMRQGVRVSVLTSINLAQVSEFSLILVALGAAAGHIARDTASIIVLAMVLTSTLSTYTIPYSHRLYRWLETPLSWLGFRDRFASPHEAGGSDEGGEQGARLILLGFHRNASSFLEELEEREPEVLKEVLVLDFNPNVHRELRKRGIACIYADVSQMALLREAGIARAEWVLSTVPDSVLVGITNLALVKQVRRLAPESRIVATAETVASALQMYAAGADYVLAPRLASAEALFEALEHDKAGSLGTLREQHISALKRRHEVVS